MENQRQREVPAAVKQALLRGDREALSKMGKRGAEHGAALKQFDAHKDNQSQQEAADLEEREGRISPEGDVLPPASGNH